EHARLVGDGDARAIVLDIDTSLRGAGRSSNSDVGGMAGGGLRIVEQADDNCFEAILCKGRANWGPGHREAHSLGAVALGHATEHGGNWYGGKAPWPRHV